MGESESKVLLLHFTKNLDYKLVSKLVVKLEGEPGSCREARSHYSAAHICKPQQLPQVYNDIQTD